MACRSRLGDAGRKPRHEDIIMALTRWQPNRTPSPPPLWPVPPLATALGRGLMGCCPACGKAHLFNGFLRVVDVCPVCHAPLGSARADDAPPYFVILIT